MNPFPAAAQDADNTEVQSMVDYEKLFLEASPEDRITVVSELEAVPENEILIQKLVDYIFSQKDYSGGSVSLELYAAASQKMLEFIGNRPNSASLFSIENLTAAIAFLSSYGYESAYPILYRLRSAAFPAEYRDRVKAAVADALADYKSPRFSNVLSVILNNPVNDVHEILVEVEKDTFLSPAGKGSLFEAGLGFAMEYTPKDHIQSSIKASIQHLCVKNISSLRWGEATDLVIRYFDQLLGYTDIAVVKKQLLETIDCLGNLMTAEAIDRLNVYLSLINRYADKGLEYDAETVTAVIENLGKAGDIRSFGNLSNATKAPYPADIIEKAETALSSIRVLPK